MALAQSFTKTARVSAQSKQILRVGLTCRSADDSKQPNRPVSRFSGIVSSVSNKRNEGVWPTNRSLGNLFWLRSSTLSWGSRSSVAQSTSLMSASLGKGIFIQRCSEELWATSQPCQIFGQPCAAPSLSSEAPIILNDEGDETHGDHKQFHFD